MTTDAKMKCLLSHGLNWLVISGVLLLISDAAYCKESSEETNSSRNARHSSLVGSFGQSLRVQAGDVTEITIRNRAGEVTNTAQLATKSVASVQVADCQTPAGDICYEWPEDRKLQISRHIDPSADVDCFNVTWTALNCVSQILQDCYSLKQAHWFGGFEDADQYWPMNEIQKNMNPYITGDTWSRQYGNVQERLFVSSNGFGIYIYPEVPLYLSFNQSGDGLICVAAKYEKYPYLNPENSLPVLRYQICQAGDVKALHGHMASLHVPKPGGVPAEDLFDGGIWSTWAMYKGPINQTLVLQFAHDIVNSGFPYSQLEIDDNWTPKYGDMDFDASKFPDPAGMVARLNQLGFRVTTWVHPFINLDAANAELARTRGYLVRALDSTIPALVKWWRNDVAYLLDVTNPEAVDWFLGNLRHLQEAYNVTSFKFDGGDGNFLPNAYSTNVTLSSPEEYTRLYIELAYRSDQNVRAQEVRVATRSQAIPIMFRMLDRQSSWGYQRGLKTVIPCTLTFGLIGYPFVLPDMIGGNGADESSPDYLENSVYPDPELFVRWIQVNTFLPFLQFSVTPYVYNKTIQDICRRSLNLRAKYTHRILALAKEASLTGSPIIRPLWWISPRDPDALTAQSQFLLGDDLLVAPVVDKGSRSRDVYLPVGTWKDENTGGSYEGPRWLRGYSADLDVLPFFQKV